MCLYGGIRSVGVPLCRHTNCGTSFFVPRCASMEAHGKENLKIKFRKLKLEELFWLDELIRAPHFISDQFFLVGHTIYLPRS